MTNGKCGNQNKNAFPIMDCVYRAQSQDEQYVIVPIYVVQDMILPQTKIKLKLVHY
jgi:hypothetical protein